MDPDEKRSWWFRTEVQNIDFIACCCLAASFVWGDPPIFTYAGWILLIISAGDRFSRIKTFEDPKGRDET